MKERMEKGTLVIGFDYELQAGADASRHYEKNWGMKDYEGTEQLLELLGHYDVKAVFYCLGEAAKHGQLPHHAPEQIRKIRKAGHEVGSHGVGHRSILDMKYSQLKVDLYESKLLLEKLLEEKIASFSMPWNLPKQFLEKLAFSVPPDMNKLDIADVLKACGEANYKTCRVCYSTFWDHVQSIYGARQFVYDPEFFGNVLALRISSVRAFEKDSLKLIDEAIKWRKICFLTSHPHSFLSDSGITQADFDFFMEEIKKRERDGKLWVATPKGIYDYLTEQ